MRSGVALVLVALLVAAWAAPFAAADHDEPPSGRERGAESGRAGEEAAPQEEEEVREEEEVVEEEAPPPPVRAPRKSSTSGSAGPLRELRNELDDVAPAFGLATLGLLGVGLLVVAAMAARRALRPKPTRPPRKSFQAGRVKGVHDGMRHEPLEALAKSGLGEAQAVPHGAGYSVTLRRARGTPCEYAGGYLAGLFEGAWAEDVRVAHPACAGKDRKAACVFVVERVARTAPSRGAAPTEASWIRG